MAHLNEVAEGKEARERKRLIKRAKGERESEPKSDSEPAKEKGNLKMAKDAKARHACFCPGCLPDGCTVTC